MITLKNLSEATKQEVFDQVAKHLLTQKQKSLSSDGGCMYRGNNNLKCAAGCFIADDEYDAVMDDMDVSSWPELVYNDLVPNTHIRLITQLQAIHDTSEPDQWKKELCSLAAVYNLSFNIALFK